MINKTKKPNEFWRNKNEHLEQQKHLTYFSLFGDDFFINWTTCKGEK